MPRDVDLIPGATSSLRRRLYAKIVRGKSRNDCYTWTGAVAGRAGRKQPKIRVGGRGSQWAIVVRILLALRDRVPLTERKGLEAGHKCWRNSQCVNVRHLRWVTRIENEDDKHTYGEFEQAFDRLMEDFAEEDERGAA